MLSLANDQDSHFKRNRRYKHATRVWRKDGEKQRHQKAECATNKKSRLIIVDCRAIAAPFTGDAFDIFEHPGRKRIIFGLDLIHSLIFGTGCDWRVFGVHWIFFPEKSEHFLHF